MRAGSEISLTASAANIVQVDCASASTKMSTAKCYCICRKISVSISRFFSKMYLDIDYKVMGSSKAPELVKVVMAWIWTDPFFSSLDQLCVILICLEYVPILRFRLAIVIIGFNNTENFMLGYLFETKV